MIDLRSGLHRSLFDDTDIHTNMLNLQPPPIQWPPITSTHAQLSLRILPLASRPPTFFLRLIGFLLASRLVCICVCTICVASRRVDSCFDASTYPHFGLVSSAFAHRNPRPNPSLFISTQLTSYNLRTTNNRYEHRSHYRTRPQPIVHHHKTPNDNQLRH